MKFELMFSVNMEGKQGACGFLSVLVPSAIPVYLVKIDEETGEPVRDEKGLCVVCKAGKIFFLFIILHLYFSLVILCICSLIKFSCQGHEKLC